LGEESGVPQRLADAMAFEADFAGTSQAHYARLAAARQRAFRRAERHSRLVRFLRRGLPALAVVVLAAYFVSTRMSVTVGDVTASVDGMEVADGNLRMLNPTLKGADKKNGDYVVKADYADQDIQNPNLIKLHAIKADVTNPSGGWSKMQAVRGKFDSKTERLIMKDRITVATSAGLTGELSYATLDMSTQTLRSHNPVSFDLPNGTVRANAMTLRSREHTIVFRGNVAVQFTKPQQPVKSTANANTPPSAPEGNAGSGESGGLAATP
jgi:lipopolysaccharide export system protein LptC